jgi:hypothetical protein
MPCENYGENLLTDESKILVLNSLVQPRTRYPFHMTQKLPHIKIPVGDKEDKCVLQALLDTCAGTSLGLYSYHKKIAETYKHLVVDFTDLNAEDYREEFIGGVDGESASVTIKAAVTYLLPYVLNGKRSKFRLGLCENLAAKTLLGLTLQRDLKLSINLGNDTVYSPVISESFKLEYLRPMTDAEPPHEFPGKNLVLFSPTLHQL